MNDTELIDWLEKWLSEKPAAKVLNPNYPIRVPTSLAGGWNLQQGYGNLARVAGAGNSLREAIKSAIRNTKK